jgi:hypothetical protein
VGAVVRVLPADLLEAFAEDLWPNPLGYLTPRWLELGMIHEASSGRLVEVDEPTWHPSQANGGRIVSLVEAERTEPKLACTLGPEDARAQLDDWANLRQLWRKTGAKANGMRLWFDSSAEVPLRAVAAKEAVCCAFLSLEVVGDGDLVRLEIISDHADAPPVIALLAEQATGQAFE